MTNHPNRSRKAIYMIQLQNGRYVGQILHGFRGHVPLARAGTFGRYVDAFNVAQEHRQFGARVVEAIS